jgi:hypothetical protein
MPFLFRTAALISRKQPYVDWANSLDPDGPLLTEELVRKRDVYLGPYSPVEQTLEKALDAIWEHVFEEELFGWSTDESQWPQQRTREMFHAWFDVELADAIIDLVPDEPLTEDDMEFAELDAAMHTCAWCKSIVIGEGRVAAFALPNRELFEDREGRVVQLVVGPKRIVTGVMTPADSDPAREEADLLFTACSRRCEKSLLKTIPRALSDLAGPLASAAKRYSE